MLQALGFDESEGEVPSFDARRRVYVVDDVDSLLESQQQQLFVLMNEIRSGGTARFVAAGNAAPMHLDLRDDVRTRLAWGLVYQVHALSDEEKAQALSAHAASRGFGLSGDVVEYLLTSHATRHANAGGRGRCARYVRLIAEKTAQRAAGAPLGS